jgi:hypothetical protein
MANALHHSDSSASESDESLDANYDTPDTDDWSEPERDPSTQDFRDREYELKVREHQHAIRKAYPRAMFPNATTKAERRTEFQNYIGKKEAGFYDEAVRQTAEQHVRWQARPKQAYNLILRSLGKKRRERASPKGGAAAESRGDPAD